MPWTSGLRRGLCGDLAGSSQSRRGNANRRHRFRGSPHGGIFLGCFGTPPDLAPVFNRCFGGLRGQTAKRKIRSRTWDCLPNHRFPLAASGSFRHRFRREFQKPAPLRVNFDKGWGASHSSPLQAVLAAKHLAGSTVSSRQGVPSLRLRRRRTSHPSPLWSVPAFSYPRFVSGVRRPPPALTGAGYRFVPRGTPAWLGTSIHYPSRETCSFIRSITM